MIYNAVGYVSETVLADGVSSSAVTEAERVTPPKPNFSYTLLDAFFVSSSQVTSILPKYTCYPSIYSAFQVDFPIKFLCEFHLPLNPSHKYSAL
jgi:hypothetical protein